MAKEALKKLIRSKQGDKCYLTGKTLPENTALFDTDRQTPKAEGGIYTTDNTKAATPPAHMDRHGNLKVRTPEFENLKSIVDERSKIMQTYMKINNQILAYKRGTDHPREDTMEFYNRLSLITRGELKKRDKELDKAVKEVVKTNKLAQAIMKVKAVGPITAAHCLVYIDLEKADHISSVWKYAGFHKASYERYEKGVAGGGNKTLRTALYTMATSQVKLNGPYRAIYDQIKNRLTHSNKITKSRNTQGKLVEIAWRDTKPSHRDGAGLRAIMKLFLSDYWIVGRTIMGLPLSNPYAEDILGNGHKNSSPKERGWIY